MKPTRHNAARTRWAVLHRLALSALLGWTGLVGRAESPAFNEYEVKAAFLFNFTQFVEWPPAAFATAASPIHIGVLGDDPFGELFDQTVRGEMVKNRTIVIKRARRVEDLTNCHVLFIAKSEKPRLVQIMSVVQGRPILTVSDLDQFNRRGGIINFFFEGNKVRFEINLAAAERAGLKISSKLLKLGKVAGTAFALERG